jgi:hypothetical protein
MQSRLEFYELGENLSKYANINLIDLISKVDSLFTYLNSVETNSNTSLKIEMVRRAESRTKEMLQIIISKVNPDLNRLIELDNKENDSHRNLILCISRVQDKIETQKLEILNKLSNLSRNDITNKISLNNFSAYLHGIINDLIFNPLRDALFKYMAIEKMEEPVTNSIKTFENKLVSIKKDNKLYWYLVFSYMLESSQIIGFLPQNQIKSKPFDITDARKLITSIMKQKNQSQTDKNPEEKKENKLEKPEELEETEEPEETEDEEQEEETEEPDEEFEFPKVNGAEENL